MNIEEFSKELTKLASKIEIELSLDEIEKMCPNLDGMMEGNVIFSKGSTIIDCSDDEIKILREGPITIEQINEIKKICF